MKRDALKRDAYLELRSDYDIIDYTAKNRRERKLAMKSYVQLLDCTLRDGCYIVDSKFGSSAIRGIIKKLQDAGTELIECGWLKNQPHESGSAFYHVPQDLEQYLTDRKKDVTYLVMIDWDRYDLDFLPLCDGRSIDAIRVVFPHGKHREGVEVGQKIKEKGYQVFFQAANTLAYSNEDLVELAETVNRVMPVSLSIVDTFGAMYEEDLERIAGVLDQHLDPQIKLGFHSHNNQQLSFSLTTHFIKLFAQSERGIIVDASLCGMGRGAGNATTELVVSYLNRKCSRNYDMASVLDAIDQYMGYYQENYRWGYSTPYFIAGLYCCHVNNIAYLTKNHRTSAKDMHTIIESMSPYDRRKYDYDLLEQAYMENQSRKVDDDAAMDDLREAFAGQQILLLAPGQSVYTEKEKIDAYIAEHRPLVVMVNAITPHYEGDYLFVINTVRYNYAREAYPRKFSQIKKILLSNVKTHGEKDETIVNFSRVNKMGWKYFDNAVIDCLRLMDQLHVAKVSIAGFDCFKSRYNETYADKSLPTINPDGNWQELNAEIADMFRDFSETADHIKEIEFVTESGFNPSKR